MRQKRAAGLLSPLLRVREKITSPFSIWVAARLWPMPQFKIPPNSLLLLWFCSLESIQFEPDLSADSAELFLCEPLDRREGISDFHTLWGDRLNTSLMVLLFVRHLCLVLSFWMSWVLLQFLYSVFLFLLRSRWYFSWT